MAVSEITDPLVLALGNQLDQCADELGVAGCNRCPVLDQCRRLWGEIEINYSHNFKFKDFRQYSQKFYQLRNMRKQILVYGEVAA